MLNRLHQSSAASLGTCVTSECTDSDQIEVDVLSAVDVAVNAAVDAMTPTQSTITQQGVRGM